jgi:MYXO-CTERM domain-containing protein
VGIVYHDGFIQATTLADVLPPPPPPPPVDAGTPETPVEVDPEPLPEAPSVDPIPEAGDPPAQDFPGAWDEAEGKVGCSSSGGPLAAFALLGLLGLVRARRRR